MAGGLQSTFDREGFPLLWCNICGRKEGGGE